MSVAVGSSLWVSGPLQAAATQMNTPTMTGRKCRRCAERRRQRRLFGCVTVVYLTAGYNNTRRRRVSTCACRMALGGVGRIRTADQTFAESCLATWLRRQISAEYSTGRASSRCSQGARHREMHSGVRAEVEAGASVVRHVSKVPEVCSNMHTRLPVDTLD